MSVSKTLPAVERMRKDWAVALPGQEDLELVAAKLSKEEILDVAAKAIGELELKVALLETMMEYVANGILVPILGGEGEDIKYKNGPNFEDWASTKSEDEVSNVVQLKT